LPQQRGDARVFFEANVSSPASAIGHIERGAIVRAEKVHVRAVFEKPCCQRRIECGRREVQRRPALTVAAIDHWRVGFEDGDGLHVVGAADYAAKLVLRRCERNIRPRLARLRYSASFMMATISS
jgi:hypothetical protein